MQNKKKIIERLRQEGGHRFTKVRELILEMMIGTIKPLSAIDLRQILAAKKVVANKTTFYRELALLADKGIIREVRFRDGVRRYEMTPEKHHHHLVCTNCNGVQEVFLAENLSKEEKKIARRAKFKVFEHALEFYGLCQKCR